ncbi:MAG: reverse transcriptase family protein [Cytophagales bacterium]|nr:reverse transcriptase family protein [Cytophagales bacterium]
MIEEYRVQFQKKALEAGYTQSNIDACLSYAEPILKKGLPVIYNTSHLAGLVGYKKDYIKRAVFYPDFFYRRFEIKKKNGQSRELAEPLPSLKEIQYWILQSILKKIKVSPFAKAYRPKVGIISNLDYHVNQPMVFCMDIKDFFPSISLQNIEKIFHDLSYSNIVSNLLAKLCTLNGALPQGAPTSPYLSNLYFRQIDYQISEYCKKHKIKYTRYADDLTFSGEFQSEILFEKVKKIFDENGLEINEEKVQLMTRNMRQLVTGVVVNDKRQVPFAKRNKLRQTMYFIQKFGLQNHMEHENITQSNYVEHLLGKVNFILQMNPRDTEFRQYKSVLKSLRNIDNN